MWHFTIGSAVWVLEFCEVVGKNVDRVVGVGVGVVVVVGGGKLFLFVLIHRIFCWTQKGGLGGP